MAALNSISQLNISWTRIGRFATVGLLGTALDIGIFTLLHVGMGVPVLPANTISYSTGIINNYILHRRWTFSDRASRALGTQFAQFLAVSLSALLLNSLIVLLLAPLFGQALGHSGLADLAAKLGATVVSMCWNLVANNFWTFATEKKVMR